MQLQPFGRVRDNTSTSNSLAFQMAEPSPTPDVRVNASAGHLSVHFDELHPVEKAFSFEQPEKRIGPAAVASFIWHIVFGLLVIVMVRYTSHPETSAAVLPEQPSPNIIWLNQPGPGGGGGGGGNKMKEPPRKAELPGKDKITVPVEKAPSMEMKAKKEPDPAEQLNIPAKLTMASTETLPGAIDALAPPTLSQGSGTGGGAGTGSGSGIGPGRGSGLGDGYGGGTGGGAYRPGNGVSLPRVLREVKPQYTSDAMRAKVQGTVLLECVVQKDGSVGEVQVIRSLDSTFGLDQEAIKAAKAWRFSPGTRMGEPVPVLITIELTFTLR